MGVFNEKVQKALSRGFLGRFPSAWRDNGRSQQPRPQVVQSRGVPSNTHVEKTDPLPRLSGESQGTMGAWAGESQPGAEHCVEGSRSWTLQNRLLRFEKGKP